MVKVPLDFQDYDNDDKDIERRKNRFQYWSTLKILKQEFNNEVGEEVLDPKKFVEWVKNRYGFEPKLLDTGITDDYTITDEKKFIVYILKYGK